MPRRIAAEMTCDRCGRIWYADFSVEKQDVTCASLELSIREANGEERKVCFEALCDVCAASVAGYLTAITRKMKKASPQRKPKAKKEGAVATPSPFGTLPASTPSPLGSPGGHTVAAPAVPAAPIPTRSTGTPPRATARPGHAAP